MKIQKKFQSIGFAALATGSLFLSVVHAATSVSDPVEIVAKVNGIEIPKALFDAVLATNLAQGAKDSEDLRKVIKGELIARVVMAQEAKKLKIDKDPVVKNQLALQEQNLLAEALLFKEAESLKITDAQLRAEYKRQTDLLADAEQFEVSHIVLGNEADALQVLKSAKSGESFEKLAQSKSLDPSRQNGGKLGWLLSNQMIPTISNVVVNMSAGQIAAAPIQTQQGWHVVKLDAKRKFQAPSFEDAKPQLAQAIQTAHRAEYVQKLLKAAKIQD